MRTDPEDEGVLYKELARRLRQTRRALGLTQRAAGELVGTNQPGWSNWESGKEPDPDSKDGPRRISVEAAIVFCRRYHVTLDWLYLGDPSNLPVQLWEKIREIRAKDRAEAEKNAS